MSRQTLLPNKVYRTVNDWKKSKAGKMGNSYIKLNLDEGFLSIEPKSIYSKARWTLTENQIRNLPSYSVSVLRNGRVVGGNGSIITEDNHLMLELSHEYERNPREHSIFKRSRLPRVERYGGDIAVLTFCAAHFYYHWLFDIIARFHLLERSGLKYDKIVMNTTNLHFQNETLNLLGIDPARVLICHNDFRIEARKVIVPSLVGYNGSMPKWACEYLRNKFLGLGQKVTGYERVFISRKYARHRKVINEEQVMEILQKYGFKKVTLEHMSILEQISLFASAEVVVAPHGSGLANLVFCNPGTKVIELFAPNWVNLGYWIMSNHVGLEYYYILGEEEQTPSCTEPGWEDVVIDLQKLKDTLALSDIK